MRPDLPLVGAAGPAHDSVARPASGTGRPVGTTGPDNPGSALGAELTVAALDPTVGAPAPPAAPTLAEKVLPGVLIRPQAKPAPPPSEALLARAWLQEIPCTVVDASMRDGTIDIVGHSADPARVTEAAGRLAVQGLPNAATVNVEPLNEAFCAPVDLARELVWSREQEMPGLLPVRAAARELFVEDRIVIELGASRGFASAALFAADGTVRPFEPISLGRSPRARSLGDQAWRFPKEAGRHLLLVVTSATPLELPVEDQVPADKYLTALREALMTAGRIDQAGFAVLDTKDRPAPVANRPAKEPAKDTPRVAETTPSRKGPDPRCGDIILKAQLGRDSIMKPWRSCETIAARGRLLLRSGAALSVVASLLSSCGLWQDLTGSVEEAAEQPTAAPQAAAPGQASSTATATAALRRGVHGRCQQAALPTPIWQARRPPASGQHALVIDPLVDGVTGVQYNKTRSMEAQLTDLARNSYPAIRRARVQRRECQPEPAGAGRAPSLRSMPAARRPARARPSASAWCSPTCPRASPSARVSPSPASRISTPTPTSYFQDKPGLAPRSLDPVLYQHLPEDEARRSDRPDVSRGRAYGDADRRGHSGLRFGTLPGGSRPLQERSRHGGRRSASGSTTESI